MAASLIISRPAQLLAQLSHEIDNHIRQDVGARIERLLLREDDFPEVALKIFRHVFNELLEQCLGGGEVPTDPLLHINQPLVFKLANEQLQLIGLAAY